MFGAGERPDASAIDAALLRANPVTGPVHVTHRAQSSAGWLELLASGLTFDLAGLAPGPMIVAPEARFHFGIPAEAVGSTTPALMLAPGPHLAGAESMLPVVRVLSGLAAKLACDLGARSVIWSPTGSMMATDYFARIVSRWLEGGPFPALGLTALSARTDAGMDSVGLAFFAGREIALDPGLRETPAEMAKLAARIIDLFATEGVREGPLAAAITGGEGITAVQQANGPVRITGTAK